MAPIAMRDARSRSQGEALARGIAGSDVAGERDKIEVRGVEQELYRDIERERALPCEQSVDAGAEDERRERKVVGERDHGLASAFRAASSAGVSFGASSVRARTTAPMSAARSSTEAISKGATNWPRSRSASFSTLVSGWTASRHVAAGSVPGTPKKTPSMMPSRATAMSKAMPLCHAKSCRDAKSPARWPRLPESVWLLVSMMTNISSRAPAPA